MCKGSDGFSREVVVVVLSRSAGSGRVSSEDVSKMFQEKLKRVFSEWTVEKVHVSSL